jgi:hypothetical protein
MKKLITTLTLLGVVAAAGWFYLTPHFALMRLRAAAEAGDSQALREMVDFPAVRQSLKDEARDAVSDEIGGRTVGALGTLGGVLAGAVVDRVVDVAVQPQGIAALTRGVRPGARTRAEGADRPERDVKVKRGYESVDRFVVSFRDRESGAQHVALVMRRDGLLDWKLSAVRIGEE